MREADIQREILRMLRTMGHFAIKCPAGLIRTHDGRMIRMGEAGLPDIICGLRSGPDWFIGFIEVKKAGRRTFFQTIRDLESLPRDKYEMACGV